MRLHVTALIPANLPVPLLFPERVAQADAAFRELRGETPTFGVVHFAESAVFRVEVGDSPHEWPELAQFMTSLARPIDWYRFLRLDVPVDFDPTPPDSLDNLAWTETDWVSSVRLHAAFEVRSLIGHLALAAAIAKPGLLSLSEGVVLVDGERITSSPATDTGGIWLAADHAREHAWPPLSSIPILKTFAWLVAAPGFREGAPRGRLGRALCALSHILTEHSRLNLLWAALGLEALYCDAPHGLAPQLLTRSAALLGRPVEFKRQVSRMYNFRSRLVHGDMDFPLSYSEGAREFLEEEYEMGAIASERAAVALLIATLQRLVEANGVGLRFAEQVEVVPRNNDVSTRTSAADHTTHNLP
jgi:hypothetical protein